MTKSQREQLIPKHGGYRKLKSYQLAQLVYDVTVRFCDRYLERRSRTHDQMVQAARSWVQITTGHAASAHWSCQTPSTNDTYPHGVGLEFKTQTGFSGSPFESCGRDGLMPSSSSNWRP